MSPEIVTKKEFAGCPADIWAAGVLFYAALSGVYPFKGRDDRDLYRKISRAEYRLPEGMPRRAKELIK